jgi:hypothetical protein
MAAVLLRHRSRDAGRLNHAEHSRRFQHETIKGPLEKSGGLAFWGDRRLHYLQVKICSTNCQIHGVFYKSSPEDLMFFSRNAAKR